MNQVLEPNTIAIIYIYEHSKITERSSGGEEGSVDKGLSLQASPEPT